MSGSSPLTRPEHGTGPALPPRGRFRPPGRVRIAGFLVGVLIAAGIGALALWLPPRSSGESRVDPPPRWQRPSVSASGLAERTGVRLVLVGGVGGGGGPAPRGGGGGSTRGWGASGGRRRPRGHRARL